LITVAGLILWLCAPFLENILNLGVRDWDQHLFYYETFLKSILEFTQVPLWNPWYCGGMVLLQNPQIPVFSPFYIFAPLINSIVAMKLTIVIHYFIAAFGIFFLSRYVYHLSNIELSFVPIGVFCFNSFWSLQISEGHTWILCSAYIPFVWLGYEKYLESEDIKWAVFGAAFLALIIWSGGIYPGPLTALMLCGYAILRAALGRMIIPLKGLMFLSIYAFLFSALKLIPVMDYMRDYPRITGGREFIPPSIWPEIFFGRDQSLYSGINFPGKVWGWHEYGCYIGVALTFLFLVAVISIFWRTNRREINFRDLALVVCWIAFFILFVGDFAYVTPYRLWRRVPVLNSLHVTGRFLIPLTFISALIILSFARKVELCLPRRLWLRCGLGILCFAAIIDLISVARMPFKEAFPIDIKRIKMIEGDPSIPGNYSVILDLPRYGDVYSSMYAGLLRGQSVVNCYEPIKPKRGFIIDDPLVFSPDPGIVISNIRFSPNKVTVDVHAVSEGRVILNQNFVRGWDVCGVESVLDVESQRPIARVRAGSHPNMTFYYLPKSIFLGAGLTIFGILLAVIHIAVGRNAIMHHKSE
jgi:hypothetical protein